MVIDFEEFKIGGVVFMGFICCGSLLFIVCLVCLFLSVVKLVVIISCEGICFCNGKFVVWINIVENIWYLQSINFILVVVGIKIVLYEGKLIYFVIMVIVFFFDKYLEICDFYLFQVIG